jgi:hypothetical protein
MFGPAPAWIGDSYVSTKATYVSQAIVNRYIQPHLQVKVRFTPGKHSQITTYVYPRYRELPSAYKTIPIFYSLSDPRKALYAGPGGDYNSFGGRFFYPLLGASLILVGLYFLASVLIWRQRLLALARLPSQSQPVRLRWQQQGKLPPSVIITNPKNGSEYAWEVLRTDTSHDRRIAKFLGPLRRTTNSTRRNPSAVRQPTEAEILGEPGAHKWLILRAGRELILPISLAEPVIATDSPPHLPADFHTVVIAHRRLIAAYAGALQRARALPMFVRPPAKSGVMPSLHALRTLLCWRVLVRLHVESHVRRQLRYLSHEYTRTQMLVSAISWRADDHRRCLTELREDCQLLRGSLTDIWRRAASFLLAVAAVVPVVLAMVQIHQIQFSFLVTQILLWVVRVVLLLPGVFALIAYTDAFRCKRRLFLSSPDVSRPKTRQNIYRLEDVLFSQIGQRKHKERASDYWVYALVLLTWITFAAWVLATPGPYYPGASEWILVAVITLPLAWRFVKGIVRRRSEDR